MPSAKYSCSGSFDRLAKGNTTSDSGGAAVVPGAGKFCSLSVTGAWTTTAVEFPLGHAHQSATPIPTTAAKPPAITASRDMSQKRATSDCTAVATSGFDAT